VGRERELSDLRAALDTTRLLTLTGAGGSGKTRLAAQLAAEQLEHFPAGVWWVELAPQTDPGLVGQELARPLGIHPLGGVTTLQAVCDALAGSCTLIVLDNCEHLLEASAETAIALLTACPQVKIIATSRAPLGVPGETDWQTPPLTLPPAPATATVDALSQYDAVRLFIERAIKVRPNFVASDDTVGVIAQICTELDGIPLAIELAAARIRVRSPEQIASGLHDRFKLLTGGARSSLPRQRTLRASVEWSHELLGEHQRILLRRLGVFAGGFSLESAEQVCGVDGLAGDQILDLLAALVEQSLVQTDERGPVLRYRMLETVRQYALEQLDGAAELEATRRRHRDHYAALATEAEQALESAGNERWLTILDDESPNLAAAAEHALATDPETAMRIAVAMTFYWTLRGKADEGDAAYEAALASVTEPTLLRARAIWARGWLAMHAGDLTGAIALAEHAAAEGERLGDPSTIARALDVIGASTVATDPKKSLDILERGAMLARESADEWALGVNLVDTALALLLQEREPEALAAFDEADVVNTRIEYAENLLYSCWGRAYFAMNRGDRQTLREGMERCRERSAEVREPTTLGLALATLACDDADHGAATDALEPIGRCVRDMIAAGAGLTLGAAIRSLAYVQGALGMLDDATETLTRYASQTGDALAAFDQWTYAIWSDVERHRGDLVAAEHHAGRANDLAVHVGNEAYVAVATLARGQVAAARGQWGEADSRIHAALAIAERRSFAPIQSDCLTALAEVSAGLESYEEAARLLGAADRANADLDGRTRWKHEQASVDALRTRLETEVGAQPYAEGVGLTLEHAVALARRARGRRKRPSAGWESLTPTEVRVVELASEGLTNSQIGTQMFISGATVKVHLAHIYAKLDVPNRAALASFATARHAGNRTL
jgi:predicted ATPase/DNA-binding CsgD family transcriptional regulator